MGENQNGAHGLGHYNRVLEPTTPPALEGKKIASLGVGNPGGEVGVFITEDGEVCDFDSDCACVCVCVCVCNDRLKLMYSCVESWSLQAYTCGTNSYYMNGHQNDMPMMTPTVPDFFRGKEVSMVAVSNYGTWHFPFI
jgi:hypothetical protein